MIHQFLSKSLIIIVGFFLVHLFMFYSLSSYEKFITKIFRENEENISILPIPEDLTFENNSPENSNISEIENSENLTEITISPNNPENSASATILQIYPVYKKIVDVLSPNFDLKVVAAEENSLMGLTSEYPDSFIQYQNDSKDLILYLLHSRGYDEVRDIFTIIGQESIFYINEYNNFGNRSFYVNLNAGVPKDGYIRIIGEFNNKTFGIMVKTGNVYNRFKEIFEQQIL